VKPESAYVLLLGVVVGGCASVMDGRLDYKPPTLASIPVNVKVIDRPRELVWSTAVPALGKQFFVINNLDKGSGLINVSYSGEPERYVDCGVVSSYVKNMAGERTFTFPGASAQQSYQVMNPLSSGGLVFWERKMSVEGRVNLLFEEVGPTRTRVTASTRYVVTRSQSGRNATSPIPQTSNDSISFNSQSGASFPASAQGRALQCVATGAMERELLDLVQ
jgi:hypothetical protein